jgi:uncharacterized membrane protein
MTTGIIGTVVILFNIFVLSKMQRGDLKKFSTHILLLISIFYFAGCLRSTQIFLDIHEFAGIPLSYIEYGIYSLVYIILAYEIYTMPKTFQFAE